MNSLLQNRHSVRKFDTTKKVTREQLDSLLNAAMHAPSACNSRPWEFVVITNREIMLKIKEFVRGAKMMETASAAIVVVAIPQTGRPEGYFPQDCGAATQNILLEAVSQGLGACWCGVFPYEDRVEALGQLLNIEPPKVAFNAIAVGYADETPVNRGHFEPDKVRYID